MALNPFPVMESSDLNSTRIAAQRDVTVNDVMLPQYPSLSGPNGKLSDHVFDLLHLSDTLT